MLTSYEFLPDLQEIVPSGCVAIRATTRIEGQDTINTQEIFPDDLPMREILHIIRTTHARNVGEMLKERGEL